MKCLKCGSEDVRKNGHRRGKQNYCCKVCGRQFVESYSQRGYSDDVKRVCLKLYQSGMSFREVERLTGIGHNTIINWAKEIAIVTTEEHDTEAAELVKVGSVAA